MIALKKNKEILATLKRMKKAQEDFDKQCDKDEKDGAKKMKELIASINELLLG
jgi:hypothetical protein